jgi:hypothetical protein
MVPHGKYIGLALPCVHIYRVGSSQSGNSYKSQIVKPNYMCVCIPLKIGWWWRWENEIIKKVVCLQQIFSILLYYDYNMSLFSILLMV